MKQTILLTLLVFLAFNRHSQSGYFNYHSEIWADKAGYHVYLPAIFIYDFDAGKFPAGIDSLTGDGFKLQPNGTVQTKYGYGTALMQAPFFLIAHLAAPFLQQDPSGYSPIYHWAINIAAAFYATMGLYLLYVFLRARFNASAAWLSCALILLGSNLYYYTVTDGGMSHVYSFALFAMVLRMLQQNQFLIGKATLKQSIILGLIGGGLIVIRPTHILFLAMIPFIFPWSHRIWNKNTLLAAVTALLPLIPQLLYNQYLHGNPWFYSYQNEGFHFTTPQTLLTWFSPNNGLFLYGSIYLLILICIGFSAIKNAYYWRFLIFFLTISYVFSCWWDWTFGCSFGQRNFVEYLTIFSIPLAYFITQLQSTKKSLKFGIGLLAMLIVICNLQLVYAYDQCFYGTHVWDWKFYFHLLSNAW